MGQWPNRPRWAHAILNEAPVVGAAFEHLDAYLIASNSRRVFA